MNESEEIIFIKINVIMMVLNKPCPTGLRPGEEGRKAQISVAILVRGINLTNLIVRKKPNIGVAVLVKF